MLKRQNNFISADQDHQSILQRKYALKRKSMKNNFYQNLSRKGIMLWAALLLGSISTFAQTSTISGVVKSAGDLELIPGASVLVKGTTRGTTTDIDGEFTLQATVGEVLMF